MLKAVQHWNSADSAILLGLFSAWVVYEVLTEQIYLHSFEFPLFMSLVLQLLCCIVSPLELYITDKMQQQATAQQKAQQNQAHSPSSGPTNNDKGVTGEGDIEDRHHRSLVYNRSARLSLALHFLVLAFVLSTASWAANAALEHVQQPVKIVFKSLKLVPTMALRTLLGLRSERYSVQEYARAIALCIGIAVFSTADALSEGARFELIGIVLLIVAVINDATAPNIQERILRTFEINRSRCTFHTNWLCAVVTLAGMLINGEAQALPAWISRAENQRVCVHLFFQAVSAYIGIQFYLMTIFRFGSAVTMLLTTLRRLVSITISYAVISQKPLQLNHFIGLFIVFSSLLWMPS